MFNIFSGCSGLASVKIEDGDTVLDFESFDYNPFAGCPVEKLYLGRNINYYSPFRNNKKLTTLIISNNVTSIGDYAFYGCSGLTSVSIPNSVTSIGDYAFYDCFGLTSVTIPNSITSIGDYAFYECFGLTSVTIPNSVTSIGDYAFQNCIGLTSIHCLGTIPPNTHYSPFSSDYDSYDTYQTATLYVPKGSLSAYKNAVLWKKFKNIVEE